LLTTGLSYIVFKSSKLLYAIYGTVFSKINFFAASRNKKQTLYFIYTLAFGAEVTFLARFIKCIVPHMQV